MVTGTTGDDLYTLYAVENFFSIDAKSAVQQLAIDDPAFGLRSVVPTDWQGQHRRANNHPETVADIKSAMDTVIEAVSPTPRMPPLESTAIQG